MRTWVRVGRGKFQNVLRCLHVAPDALCQSLRYPCFILSLFSDDQCRVSCLFAMRAKHCRFCCDIVLRLRSVQRGVVWHASLTSAGQGPGECHSCAGEEREAEIDVAFEAVKGLRHKIGQPVFYTDHATEQPLSSLSVWSHSVVNCFMGEAKHIKEQAGSRTCEGCPRTSANFWTHLKVPEIPCAFLASLHRTTRNRFQLLEGSDEIRIACACGGQTQLEHGQTELESGA